MKYYTLCPEVAGEVGRNSVVDVTVRPPVYEYLHYDFVNWLVDELLEAAAAFIVTEGMAKRLNQANLSGYNLDDVEVILSPEDEELIGQGQLPKFLWLRITGMAESDDFGLSSESDLVVSERALQVLCEGHIENCLLNEI
ncbi:hypothetical protein [Desmospora activa]|uniref:Uncharacterized protein n=1 Tax=Desmospora activa DSM 45169 TaxID=1121389 RepID=A0A2T4Z0K9_9BACL|nr:hypothetical protein [Desmospora activa]PTM53271.1 hypothetical protein C8J48_3595 [Desmospora activa DSM 45169]